MSANPLNLNPQTPAEFLAANPDVERFEVVLIDVNGVPRGKWLPRSGIAKAYKSGVNFPYSVFGNDVWGREAEASGLHISTGDRDGVARLLPGTLSLVPGTDGIAAQALFSMERPDGSPFLADPRQVLAATIDKLASRGLAATVAFELEFYLFEKDQLGDPRPIFSKAGEPVRQNMYALDDLDRLAPLLDEIRRGAEQMGIPADAAVCEAAPGQFEVNLFHRENALHAADDAVLLRRMISSLARKHGLVGTFMAKPLADQPGNGMHIHASLMGKGGNIFAGQGGEERLHHAVAGLLETMPEALLLFISSFNGFRRLQPGSYAPTAICWGHDNRSVAVRIPASGEQARRVEHRIAGADANPYLVLAAMLEGIITGLDNAKAPPTELTGNAYDQDLSLLTHRFDDAITDFARSKWASDAFGSLMHKVLLEVKRQEEATYRSVITQLERETHM